MQGMSGKSNPTRRTWGAFETHFVIAPSRGRQPNRVPRCLPEGTNFRTCLRWQGYTETIKHRPIRRKPIIQSSRRSVDDPLSTAWQRVFNRSSSSAIRFALDFLCSCSEQTSRTVDVGSRNRQTSFRPAARPLCPASPSSAPTRPVARPRFAPR